MIGQVLGRIHVPARCEEGRGLSGCNARLSRKSENVVGGRHRAGRTASGPATYARHGGGTPDRDGGKRMRIKKIVLVEPGAPGYHVYSRVALPRLGLPMLAAVLRRDGHQDVRIYCEDISPIDIADVASADLVGISTTTSTSLAAYRLGSQVKRLNPRATVVLGGIHVTFMSHEPFSSEFCARHGIDMPV